MLHGEALKKLLHLNEHKAEKRIRVGKMCFRIRFSAIIVNIPDSNQMCVF